MPPPKNNAVAVIAAAGFARRYGGGKQFAALNGRAVLWHAARPFVAAAGIRACYVVVAAGEEERAMVTLAEFGGKCVVLARGGDTRARSVYNGVGDCLQSGAIGEEDYVAVHDAARPCLSDEALYRLLRAAAEHDGAALALPLGDALKTADDDGRVTANLKRDGQWLAQTPQCFRAGVLRDALARYPHAADECEAVTCAGGKAVLIRGDNRNIKITYPSDMALAAAILPALNRPA